MLIPPRGKNERSRLRFVNFVKEKQSNTRSRLGKLGTGTIGRCINKYKSFLAENSSNNFKWTECFGLER